MFEIGERATFNTDDHDGRALVEIVRVEKAIPASNGRLQPYRVRILQVTTPSPIRRVKPGKLLTVGESHLMPCQ